MNFSNCNILRQNAKKIFLQKIKKSKLDYNFENKNDILIQKFEKDKNIFCFKL